MAHSCFLGNPEESAHYVGRNPMLRDSHLSSNSIDLTLDSKYRTEQTGHRGMIALPYYRGV